MPLDYPPDGDPRVWKVPEPPRLLSIEEQQEWLRAEGVVMRLVEFLGGGRRRVTTLTKDWGPITRMEEGNAE